jgi:hypothetical protein
MSRNPEIERILEAWYAWDHALPGESTKRRQSLNVLLDVLVARGENQYTREQILDHLWDRYKDYRKQRKSQERLSTARSALGS